MYDMHMHFCVEKSLHRHYDMFCATSMDGKYSARYEPNAERRHNNKNKPRQPKTQNTQTYTQKLNMKLTTMPGGQPGPVRPRGAE